MSTREYYQHVRELYKDNPTGRKFYDYILTHGKLFTKRLSNEKIKQLAQKYGVRQRGYGYCYYHSQLLAMDSMGKLKYYEGMGLRKGLIPLEHAWNVLGNKVVDLTWEDGDEYFGIEIPISFIRKHIFKVGRADALLSDYVRSKIGG